MAADINLKKIYIENFTKFHATEQSIQKGKEIFSNGVVNFIEFDEKKDKRKFTVKGSEVYTVFIKGLSRNDIETSCTCPFDWGGICKHSVASLLHISANLDKPINYSTNTLNKGISIPIINTRRTSGSLYELTDYKIITNELIKENSAIVTYNKYNLYSYNSKINEIEIKPNSFVVKMSVGYRDQIVKFQFKDKKVFVTSTDSIGAYRLSESETLCLLFFESTPNPDILDIVFSDKIIQIKKEILKKYGLSEKANFDHYFGFSINTKNGLYPVFTENSIGFIPVLGNGLPAYIDFINKPIKELAIFESLKTKKEIREIGFVLVLNSLDDYNFGQPEYKAERMYGESEYQIVPITGKTAKNGTVLSSSIEEYDDSLDGHIQANKTENTKKLLKIIEQLSESTQFIARFELYQSAFAALANEKFVYILDNQHYGIRKSNLLPLKIFESKLDLVFEVNMDADFIKLDMKIKVGDKYPQLSEMNKIDSDYKLHFFGNKAYLVKNLEVSRYLKNYPDSLRMPNAFKDEFFNKVIKPISQNFKILFKDNIFDFESVELDFNTRQIYLTEQNDYLIIKPQVEYRNGVSASLSTQGNILVKEGDKITEFKRNIELEDEFIEMVAELHPNFESQKVNKIFYLHHTDFTNDFWFYKFFDRLHTDHVEIYGLKTLKNFKFSPYKGKISTSVGSGLDWFDIEIHVSFGDNLVSLKDIRSAVVNKQKYVQLKDGSVGIIPSEWFHKLEKYFRNGEIRKDKLEISKLRFSIIDELFDNIDDYQILEEISEKRKKLAGFTEISKTKAPKEIKGELRHYQMEGLNWLNFLHQMQWGGILADDMGLGKTLQVLTFIQQRINDKKSTSLVVVPTTLLFNWENEIKKFAPKLKAHYHYGGARQENTDDFNNYHLIFTTYGILLRDIEFLKDFSFEFVILDESQSIKNPASRRFKAASLLNAKNRFALSGTPIENSTFDLFSQMSFVNRGFFGSANNFKENYSTPIDKDSNEIVAAELQKLINPFVLRRTKEQVATELPDKTEDIIYCEMESGQRQVYDAYRNQYKNQLLNKIEDEGLGKSKLMVLEALTRLRQICDSPTLLKNEEISETQSVKIKELIRHITEKTSNHKILIFSQFVEMLSLVKDELTKLNIEFEYLDGQRNTKQREQSVNNFQENENLRVFLISLKAGGTGLNLTAADYVYLLDPWWNPAVENQAIDRCYRIGQDKKVFAYRMICKNTVEEKILQLQNKKMKIATDIIQTDENIMKTLDIKDIKDLFS